LHVGFLIGSLLASILGPGVVDANLTAENDVLIAFGAGDARRWCEMAS
jgi:hypothetical protein